MIELDRVFCKPKEVAAINMVSVSRPRQGKSNDLVQRPGISLMVKGLVISRVPISR